jgi:hypothetical protein
VGLRPSSRIALELALRTSRSRVGSSAIERGRLRKLNKAPAEVCRRSRARRRLLEGGAAPAAEPPRSELAAPFESASKLGLVFGAGIRSSSGVLNSLVDFIVDFSPHQRTKAKFRQAELHLSCRFLLPRSIEQLGHCGLMHVASRLAVAHRIVRFDPF